MSQELDRDSYQVGDTVFYGEFAKIAREMDENGEWDEEDDEED